MALNARIGRIAESGAVEGARTAGQYGVERRSPPYATDLEKSAFTSRHQLELYRKRWCERVNRNFRGAGRAAEIAVFGLEL